MKNFGKKIINFFTSRMVIVAIFIMLQAVWLVVTLMRLMEYYAAMQLLVTVLSFLLVLEVVKKWNNPAYKLSWSILILAVPVIGIFLYLLFGQEISYKHYKDSFKRIHEFIEPQLVQDPKVLEELKKECPVMYKQMCYASTHSMFPVHGHTQTKYFAHGESNFDAMIRELRKAKHFIFMEYFIVDEGYMWETILKVLEEKVAEGVEVRFLYDDMGCIQLLPTRYARELQEKGINCRRFNPVMPLIAAIMNNRDHRKITVIDGHTGFTGGINLADEYINRIVRFGYWKDCGIQLTGHGVSNLTMMFLEMWNVVEFTDKSLKEYFPHYYYHEDFGDDGYVLPYGSSPLDHENLAENVYLNIINNASKYVYIYTPYLVLDNEMITALTLAAKNGVDVRIVMPHIPDKKLIFVLSRSYYEQLIAGGVKIYEYLPGFLHSKCFLCDDEIATIGTINLDYRSFYMHFECGVLMYQTNAVSELIDDFSKIWKKTKQIDVEFCQKQPIQIKALQSLMRLFAPLL